MIYKAIMLSACLSFMLNVNAQTSTTAAATSPSATTTTNTIKIRQSTEDLTKKTQNAQLVTALQTAFQNMRANTNPNDPKSLQYWINTHNHFSDDANTFIENRRIDCEEVFRPSLGTPAAKSTCANYLNRVKINYTPNAANAKVWGQCQHGTLHFLTWHRMYLHFFEKMLRKQSATKTLAANPDLIIPYWSYFENAVLTSKTRVGLPLPSLVTAKSSPLYNEFRTRYLNPTVVSAATTADPKATRTVQGTIASTSAVTSQAFKAANFQGFQSILEKNPHGSMHCALGTTCNTPDMGFLQTAGHDPLFYMHHANIDRLWNCWMKQKIIANRTKFIADLSASNAARRAAGKPTLSTTPPVEKIDLAWAKANLGMNNAWFEQTFYFPDADKNNEIVAIKVADLFKPEIMPQYANETSADSCLQAETTALSKVVATIEESNQNQYGILTYLSELFSPKSAYAATTSSVDAVSQAASTVLNGFSNKVKMINSTTARVKTDQDIRFTPGNTVLIISSVLLPKTRPPVAYDIYICNDKIQPGPAGFVAQISYFGMLPAEMKGHSGQHSTQLSYDVTTQLQNLGITKYSDARVCFEPYDPLADSNDPTLSKSQGQRNIASTLVLGKIYLEKAR